MELNFPKPPRVGRPKTTDRYRFEISLDPMKDKEIIEKLEEQPNKSEYIRQLIRVDIE